MIRMRKCFCDLTVSSAKITKALTTIKTVIVILSLVLLFQVKVIAVDTDAYQQAARDQLVRMNVTFSNEEFMKAVMDGKLHIVKLFLQAGISSDTSIHSERTVLIEAAAGGHTEIVRTLLKAGANVNKNDIHNWTALLEAAKRGYYMIAYELLNVGADINVKGDYGESTALMWAVKGGFSDIVELLLKNGASAHEKDVDGTSMIIASTMELPCKTRIVRMLIEAGANLNETGMSGETALMNAAGYGCTEIVMMLLKAGMDPNVTDNIQQTALMKAVVHERTEAVKILLEADAESNVQDNEGVTALMLAAKRGDIDIAMELLLHEADPDLKDTLTGRTALMVAALHGHDEFTELLLQRKAYVNEMDNEGWTALHWAVYKGSRYLFHLLEQHIGEALTYKSEQEYIIPVDEAKRLNIVKFLLTNGAEADARTKTLGIIPLMWASLCGNEQVVTLLIHSGAHVNAQTTDGMNARQFALLGNNQGIASLLADDNNETGAVKGRSIHEIIQKHRYSLLMEIARKIPWMKTSYHMRFDDFDDKRLEDLLIVPVLRNLTSSKEGNELLLQFILAHPEHKLRRMAQAINYELIQHKLDMAFWTFVANHLDNYYDTFASWAVKLPYEERLKLVDVWLEQLNKINPADIAIKNESQKTEREVFAYHLIQNATKALYGIYDARIISAYHRILDEAPASSLLAGAAWTLYRMGDPESYSYLKRYATALGLHQSSLLKIADERNAMDYARTAGLLDQQKIASLSTLRPDLARGIVRNLLNDPAWVDYIKENGTVENSSKFHSLFNAISAGASVFSDAEVLAWMKKAKNWDATDFMLIWIDILGKRDTTTGNEELMSIARYQCGAGTSQEERLCQMIRKNAARSLGKHLLGKKRNDVIKRLQLMKQRDRGELVQCIMGALDLFPRVILPCSFNRFKCEGCSPSNYFQHFNPDNEPVAGYLQQYEDKLLDWIIWAPSSTDLSYTYGFMKSKEAHSRFTSFLDRISEDAILFSWIYKRYPSVPLLKGLLPYFKEGSIMHDMILFMLSESGDKETFLQLKHRFEEEKSAHAEPRNFTIILERYAQDKDYEALRQKADDWISQLSTQKIWDSNSHNIKQYIIKIIALLLQQSPEKAMSLINQFDLNGDFFRTIIIEACRYSQTSHCEPALKLAARHYEMQNGLSMPQNPDPAEQRVWLNALQATNTEWCRDTIVQNADRIGPNVFNMLASMGDQRALTVTISRGKDRVNMITWLGALSLGGIDQVVRNPELQSERKIMELPAFDYDLEHYIFRKQVSPLSILNWSTEQKQTAQHALLESFKTYSAYERFALVHNIGATYAIWNDELIREALADSYAPVRLAMLQMLLHYPRPGLNKELENIAKTDPVPWCRRFAQEILLFRVELLSPDKGIFISF
ncbi:MAG: hypothetical protein A2Y62_04615 [Candidatus Fischerbacteria bacterium RBG_13_37_8]|uniref:Uncharacterized protein n=1 Tax=Candidatus Fischerbacteria bacterium RBG_13_37_8 TaxID=1817863 RepID=A0A1F5VP24_9BACT|nr:MAG: hypothetical protein A2Y62_04615 [Candidatus Fischerbacteria bacterium RBG_13_37_8]